MASTLDLSASASSVLYRGVGNTTQLIPLSQISIYLSPLSVFLLVCLCIYLSLFFYFLSFDRLEFISFLNRFQIFFFASEAIGLYYYIDF